MDTKRVQPVLIESLDKTNLLINTINGRLLFDCQDIIKEHAKYYSIVLISLEDDNIEKDDMYVAFGNTGTYLLQCADVYNGFLVATDKDKYPFDTYNCKKVVATYSQIPYSYITKLIKDYNSGNMKDFEIEWLEDFGHIDKDYDENDHENAIKIQDEPKLNSEGYIIIIDK